MPSDARHQPGDFLLPYGFFDCLPLMAADLEYLESLARHTLEATLNALQCHDATAWSSLGDVHGAHLFQGKPRPSEPHIVPFRSSAKMAASLDEVRDVVANVSTEAMAQSLRVRADDVMDMKVLYRLQSPTPDAPHRHVLVRWVAIACPTPLQNRDFCVLEVQDQVRLASGQRAWVVAQHSVRLPCCPDLKSAFQLVRGAIANSGMLFAESNEAGVLYAHSHVEMDLKGNLPSFVYKKLMKRRVSHIVDLQSTIVSRRTKKERSLSATMHFSPRHQATPAVHVPSSERSHCNYCSKRFHAFRHKHHCSTCGEIFCSKCTGTWKSMHASTQRVCVTCSNAICDRFSDAQSPVFGCSPNAAGFVSPAHDHGPRRPQYSPSCMQSHAPPMETDDPLLAAWQSLRLSSGGDVPVRDMQSEKTTSTLQDLCDDPVSKLLAGDWDCYDPTATIDISAQLQQAALERSFGHRPESRRDRSRSYKVW
ncbi:hypothetical protein SDRG_16527 [Saprolegnia diclina VS20]|uniref:FYVE-type domain-containing protein n=1 Tax=Saprolegnia diclina (strain VS20) TaxID=1156394 RepID=T0PX47_SAPDV|nr:hypothetical protein SDRG_16527 [Saprolegnia diclina VS20]EQC25595.1 hypothetical protein SDRG_16527 [Saprolegnia diclina VS20]|eukprot:XP_008620963.1 hypothetical protein SDRG_16527 [Saprolegnia diclina VS20]